MLGRFDFAGDGVKAVEDKPEKGFLFLLLLGDIGGDVGEITGERCALQRVTDMVKAFDERSLPDLVSAGGSIERHFRIGKKLCRRKKGTFQALGASCENGDLPVFGGEDRHDLVIIPDGRFPKDQALYGLQHGKASFQNLSPVFLS